eukprot:1891100-Prymnesium_polylepis.3
MDMYIACTPESPYTLCSVHGCGDGCVDTSRTRSAGPGAGPFFFSSSTTAGREVAIGRSTVCSASEQDDHDHHVPPHAARSPVTRYCTVQLTSELSFPARGNATARRETSSIIDDAPPQGAPG